MTRSLARKKPGWLKTYLPAGDSATSITTDLRARGLHTICTSARCPNRGECWGNGTATFLIGGDTCTRACRFCNVKSGRPAPLDPGEPENVARSVQALHLRHAVITSVDRDDLPDLGVAHWTRVIREIKKIEPVVTMETLIPDFQGRGELVRQVIAAAPDVISHNLETVRRLSPGTRSGATHDRSLAVIQQIADAGIVSKSGIMLGLGETPREILETMDELRAVGCQVITIGQYLQPSPRNIPVVEYIAPERFEELRHEALRRGFRHVESAPLVRSSYHAERHA